MKTDADKLTSGTVKALEKLQLFFTGAKNVIVAFSGGMDSSFLVLAAHKYLPGRCQAVLVNSEFMSAGEIQIARTVALKSHFALKEIEIKTLNEPLIASNQTLRCYHCKKLIFQRIIAESQPEQTVCEGSVTDDIDDYRPGRLAIKELGISSPLLACGISKEMVAEVLQCWGAAHLIRSAQSCLATRIETGSPITPEILQQIEKGEHLLNAAGVKYFRLRHHNNLARIEVAPDQIHRTIDILSELSSSFRKLGYKHVCIDVNGYQKGSMNADD